MIPIVECHTHTNFSPDGSDSPESMIKRAIENGTKHYCFTDHMDLLYNDPTFKAFDLDEYIACITSLKQKYADKIYINIGLEVGYHKKNYLLNQKVLEGRAFDFIISSVHEVNGSDCYYKEHYLNRDRQTVYGEYFQAVLESILVPYNIDAVGHLAYVSRTAPYPNNMIERGEFDGILSEIFKTIIKKNLILELNTNVYNSSSACLPNLPLLQMYHDCGGKKICFASDAHALARLGDKYTQVSAICKNLGYKNWTVKQNGKHIEYPI